MPDKEKIKILFFGDIVGKPGRRALIKALPEIKKELKPDLTIANAENLAHGLGVTEKTMNECLAAGVDLFTSGNHIWEKPEIYRIFEDPGVPLLRPANYPDQSPGQGYKIITVAGKRLLVINLNGRVFIEEELSCPFQKIDQILGQYKNEKIDGIIVDFHAEATSEKVALGWHLDGRVSAVIGTHTHVPTADEKILPAGTAYITDAGMVGLKESVIGINKEVVIHNFIQEKSKSHEIDEHGLCQINGVIVTIDPAKGRAVEINRIWEEEKI